LIEVQPPLERLSAPWPLAGIFARLLLWLCGGLTIAGLLAPAWPLMDAVNHGRPMVLLAALLAGGLAIVVSSRAGIRFGFGLVALNVVLMCLPLIWQAPALSEPFEAADRLKLITVNVYVHNADYGALDRFLRADPADAVFLQELKPELARDVVRGLLDLYPHVARCLGHGCLEVILSKWPIGKSIILRRGPDNPPMVIASIEKEKGRNWYVMNTHLARPNASALQARQIDYLIRTFNIGHVSSGIIVAGDFNLTPWSWKLNKLSWFTGLHRHATFLRSWQADLPFVPPAFLIDHVLTTPDIRAESIRTGPFLGSDHLPVIAELVMLRRP
jgi:endonuclease/exonuclease/phosphatase (EEP) superfamily protein YafD